MDLSIYSLPLSRSLSLSLSDGVNHKQWLSKYCVWKGLVLRASGHSDMRNVTLQLQHFESAQLNAS